MSLEILKVPKAGTNLRCLCLLNEQEREVELTSSLGQGAGLLLSTADTSLPRMERSEENQAKVLPKDIQCRTRQCLDLNPRPLGM